MVRKKIDNRIRVLIENGVAEKHRTMFMIIGDHGRDQVGFSANKCICWIVTAAGIVQCGGCKTSPSTSTIVQFIYYFWSFEISVNILSNQK